MQEYILEIQPSRLQAALAPQRLPRGIDSAHSTGADTNLGSIRQMGNLNGQALGQHDVIRTKRRDQAAPGPRDRLIQRSRQALVSLYAKVEAMCLLQGLDPGNTVIAGAVVHDQQLDMGITLRQYAEDAGLDVRRMIVGRDYHADQRLLMTGHGNVSKR
ncbi:hypothetical protein D9M70_448780 [compost metagenome]